MSILDRYEQMALAADRRQLGLTTDQLVILVVADTLERVRNSLVESIDSLEMS